MISMADRYRFQQRVGVACFVLLLACYAGAHSQQTAKGQDDAAESRRDDQTRAELPQRRERIRHTRFYSGAVSPGVFGDVEREREGAREVVRASSKVRRQWPGADRSIDLSRACWLESGHRLTDCAALAFVIARRAVRAGSTFSEMLVAYSALGHSTARARMVRTWPWGDIADATKAHNARWRRLREHVTRIAAGVVPDPCTGGRALHWGSRTVAADVARGKRAVDSGRWRRVWCGRVANQFYALVRR